MKKLFMLAVALMSVCAVSAQNELIAKFNEGLTALGANNHNAAIESFETFIDKGADSEDATVLAIEVCCSMSQGISIPWTKSRNSST